VEGVCRYWSNGVEYIANYGKPNVPLKSAYCKNGIGYGLPANCTHPCRTLAAATGIYKGGEVLFFPELVGRQCGSGPNKMIHDGFMVVNDTGAEKIFKHEGRFDFFWGECNKFKDGVCQDSGAREVAKALTHSAFCRVWRPGDPDYNAEIAIAFQNAIRTEAIARGDGNAASYEVASWVGGPKAPIRAMAAAPKRLQTAELRPRAN
jgi:hypothetical protein